MAEPLPHRFPRFLLALGLPVAAFLLQRLCWDVIHPYVWFLFFPAVFFSPWLGGRRAGQLATVLSAALVWWCFMTPLHRFTGHSVPNGLATSGFLLMGFLFSEFHERLRLAHQRLTESQADLLGRMSRMAQVGGWDFDPATGQGHWTGETARIHGLPEGTPIDVAAGLDYYLPAHRPAIERAVAEAVQAGAPFDLECQLRDAQGRVKWVRTQGQAVTVHGKVVRVQGAMQDIDDRKRAELAVRQLNADLERRVEERTAELRSANRELESFAYAVSHDLRGPLRAMNGFSRALLEDCGPALAGEGQGHLAQIMEASTRMGSLIDGILLLSSCTRGELRRDRVDLTAMAVRLAEELASGEPGRQVAWTLQPDMTAWGDERMLEVVLSNLLGNAWKYTGRTGDARIAVEACRCGDRTEVRITDNGAGFDEAYAAKLYLPFQRLHRQEEFPGLGIGLATAQRILQRHGGSLRGASQPGRGATFTFTLPDPSPEALR